MPVEAGTRMGRYIIRSELGTGGMGEVYLGQDTQLDRTVALKILPADFATSAERMRRFLQEARAASALNHPNAAHIYEIGEACGTAFIAMEYVEGETLGAKVAGRPLNDKEIADIGIQIADCLDEAHAKGIVHRDIKPSNIMLTMRGQVKILDFGSGESLAARRRDYRQRHRHAGQDQPRRRHGHDSIHEPGTGSGAGG